MVAIFFLISLWSVWNSDVSSISNWCLKKKTHTTHSQYLENKIKNLYLRYNREQLMLSAGFPPMLLRS